MKIAIYSDNLQKELSNSDFQRKHWDRHWEENSFYNLVKQLPINPIYWELLEIIKKKDNILEAGCGAGQWVWMLSKHGYHITGVDFAGKTITITKRHFPKLDLRRADVKKLPFKDSTFDVYISFGVVEHFPEGPDAVLAEAHRVVKKNGLLFLTIPYLNLFRLFRYKKLKTENGQFYQYLYDKREIKEKVNNAGFRVTRVKKYDFINAVTKDFPFSKLILTRKKDDGMKAHIKNTGKLEDLLKIKKPSFFLSNFLYHLDSYILLIEARKQ